VHISGELGDKVGDSVNVDVEQVDDGELVDEGSELVDESREQIGVKGEWANGGGDRIDRGGELEDEVCDSCVSAPVESCSRFDGNRGEAGEDKDEQEFNDSQEED
jgi:hypothetical protein